MRHPGQVPHEITGSTATRSPAFRPFSEGSDELSSYAFENPIDVVVETVGGHAATLDQAIFAVRPGGTIVVLGVFVGHAPINALVLMLKEIRLIGSLMYGRYGARADFDVALDILHKNRTAAASLITHRIPLRQVADGYRIAADKKQKSIKVTIEP